MAHLPAAESQLIKAPGLEHELLKGNSYSQYISGANNEHSSYIFLVQAVYYDPHLL